MAERSGLKTAVELVGHLDDDMVVESVGSMVGMKAVMQAVRLVVAMVVAMADLLVMKRVAVMVLEKVAGKAAE